MRVYRIFADLTDECCLQQWGLQCVFPDEFTLAEVAAIVIQRAVRTYLQNRMVTEEIVGYELTIMN